MRLLRTVKTLAIEIKGMNSLLKKLDKLSKIEAKEAVQEVADDLTKALQSKASEWSTKSKYIKAYEPRNYGLSSYVDVGLKSSEAPFDEWKELWFQNYGFDDMGLNFSGQYHITNHLMWFDEAINEEIENCKAKLKAKIKQQVNECWNG